MQWRSSYVQWIQRTFIHATYWEVVALLIGNGSARSVHSVVGAGKLWSTSPSAPGRPSLVVNPARKGTLSSIARTPPAVASRRYARTGGQRKTSGKLHVCARVPFDGSEIVFKPRRARPESATGSSLGSVVPRYCKEQNTLWLRAPLSKNSAKNTPEEGHARDKRGMTWALTR